MAIRIALLSLLLVSTAHLGTAQRQAYMGELSLPFGTAPGKLVPAEDNLIFIDDQQPESSFAIRREDIQSIEEQDGVVTVVLRRPVRDRSGERSRLSFRLQDSGGASALNSWSRVAMPVRTPAAASADRNVAGSYQAEHNHRFGSCNGRLMITEDRIIYESITDLDHSRQWSMKDIRELRRSSPYQVEIKPFMGADYTLRLIGSGMDTEDYNLLVKRITAARAGQ